MGCGGFEKIHNQAKMSYHDLNEWLKLLVSRLTGADWGQAQGVDTVREKYFSPASCAKRSSFLPV
jgi:hypothetical protein